MKAQPQPPSHTRARISTVYPLTKRSASYNAGVSLTQSSSGTWSATSNRQAMLSPRSMAASSIQKRRPAPAPVAPSPRRTASYAASTVSTSSNSERNYTGDYPYASGSTPPPFGGAAMTRVVQQRLAQQAHQRALQAQRNAAVAARAAGRTSHISSLDRGIKLLLEEEYREDVKAWMLEKEKATMASASAMDQQPELQWHMRAHLLDFLLEIHLHFRLRPETLYLTLSILDRYVSRRIVYKKHYQLVGCVALWLAAKFEDAKERVPSVKDLKELCHNAYEEGAFVQMEGHVLGTVDWDLGHPTAESWLRVLCTETSAAMGEESTGMFGSSGALGLQANDGQPFEDTRTQHVARFLMECSLYGRDYIQFPPSVLALGSLNLARYVCGKSRRLRDESPAVLQMIGMLDNTLSQSIDAVSQTLVKKYSFPYYSKASGVVLAHYLRGGRYPIRSRPAVDVPESLTTNAVSVDALRAAALHAVHTPYPPQTPVRERMEVSWGSGRTDVEETPGLVRSDSSSTGMGMDVEDESEMDEDEEVNAVFPAPVPVATSTQKRPQLHLTLPRIGADEVRMMGHQQDEDDEDEDEDEEYVDSATLPSSGHHSHSSSASSAMLTVPPTAVSTSDESSMPLTPTTPMFQLDPFGNSSSQQPLPPVHASDKENVVPLVGATMACERIAPGSAMAATVVVGVEGSEDASTVDFRQALLAIVP